MTMMLWKSRYAEIVDALFNQCTDRRMRKAEHRFASREGKDRHDPFSVRKT